MFKEQNVNKKVKNFEKCRQEINKYVLKQRSTLSS